MLAPFSWQRTRHFTLALFAVTLVDFLKRIHEYKIWYDQIGYVFGSLLSSFIFGLIMEFGIRFMLRENKPPEGKSEDSL